MRPLTSPFPYASRSRTNTSAHVPSMMRVAGVYTDAAPGAGLPGSTCTSRGAPPNSAPLSASYTLTLTYPARVHEKTNVRVDEPAPPGSQ